MVGRKQGHAGRCDGSISHSRSPAKEGLFNPGGAVRHAGSIESFKVHHAGENKMSTPATVVTPPSHWYATVWHFFKHVGVYVSDSFIALFGADSAHTFAVGAESLLRSKLGVLAWEAVQ